MYGFTLGRQKPHHSQCVTPALIWGAHILHASVEVVSQAVCYRNQRTQRVETRVSHLEDFKIFGSGTVVTTTGRRYEHYQKTVGASYVVAIGKVKSLSESHEDHVAMFLLGGR